WRSISKLFAVGFLLRIFAACLGHSGQGKAPMYGDFEAQRHWMEITIRLPASHWYFHDREWWRLDYPPLSAYHSWILGTMGTMVNASWFELYT
ncbi:glycosyltransferase family 57 protein, partial [Pseudocercospora fijiensis CIRAD86]